MSAPTIEQYRQRLPSRREWSTSAASGGALVSVVTVTWNSERTLPGTIAGMRQQDYRPLEWLVVDGGSRDGTVDLVRDEPLVADWLSERDDGISDAFNKGIAWSRGEIIGIINSDDRYLPDAVSAAVAAMHANPDADFCYGDLEWELRNGRRLLTLADERYADRIAYRMPQVYHPTVFVRRRAYERHGLFRTDLRLAMDYDLLLRLHVAGCRGVRVPRALAVMSDGGASDRNVVARFAECRRISIAHGGRRPRAWSEFIAAVAKNWLRHGLEAVGLWRVASGLRRLVNRRYREL